MKQTKLILKALWAFIRMVLMWVSVGVPIIFGVVALLTFCVIPFCIVLDPPAALPNLKMLGLAAVLCALAGRCFDKLSK